MGWVQFFLAESQSRLYTHMRAKFGRDPTAVSKKVSFNFISRTGAEKNYFPVCHFRPTAFWYFVNICTKVGSLVFHSDVMAHLVPVLLACCGQIMPD